MKKKCTNNKCRKVFVVKNQNVSCPYCGKKYPRLGTSSPQNHKGVHIFGIECENNMIGLLLLIRKWTGKELSEIRELMDSESIFIKAKEISNSYPKMADGKRGSHIKSPLKSFTEELDELGCFYEVVNRRMS